MIGVLARLLKRIPIPTLKRIPILSVIFAVLLLVSVAPLLIYGWMVIGINREALNTNEQELQNTITRSVAQEIKLQESGHQRQFQTLLRTLEPADPEAPTWDSPYVRSTLEQFVASNPNLLYVTLLNEQARGIKAGNYDAERDPFLRKSLERAKSRRPTEPTHARIAGVSDARGRARAGHGGFPAGDATRPLPRDAGDGGEPAAAGQAPAGLQ